MTINLYITHTLYLTYDFFHLNSQHYHSIQKSNDWLDGILDRAKLLNSITKRLSQCDTDSIFSLPFLPIFVKYAKFVTDTVADLTNIINKIEKRILVYVVPTATDLSGDATGGSGSGGSGSGGVIKDPRGRRDGVPGSNSRGGRTGLEEAENCLTLLAGLIIMNQLIRC